MKLSVLIFSTILLLISTEISKAQNDTEIQIKQIRKWYAEIEAKLSTCKKIEAGWDSGPNAELTGYYDENSKQFIKLVVSMTDDWYEATDSYYLNEGKLFFIFENGYNGGEFYEASELNLTEEEYWQQGREAKTLEFFQERKYFAYNLCLKYLVKNKSIPVDESEGFDINKLANEEKPVCEIFYDELSKNVNEMIETLKQEM